MKRMFKSLFALSLAGILFSCNMGSDKKKDDGSATLPCNTATSAMTEANTEVSIVPFDILTIYHSVKDYKVWRSTYDADLSRRKENGFTDIAVERAADNPNNIKIVFSVSYMSKAKSFASDPGLKEVMEKAGVTSKPDMKFWKVLGLNS
jgi:hypothetical protein